MARRTPSNAARVAAAACAGLVASCQAFLVLSLSETELPTDGGRDGRASQPDARIEASSDDALADVDASANVDALVSRRPLCDMPSHVVFFDDFDDATKSRWVTDLQRGASLQGSTLVVPQGPDIVAVIPVDTSKATGLRIRAKALVLPSSSVSNYVSFDSIGIHMNDVELWIWGDGSQWHAYAQRSTGAAPIFDEVFAAQFQSNISFEMCASGSAEFRAGNTVYPKAVPSAGSAPPLAVLHTNGPSGTLVLDDLVVEQVP